MSQQDLFSKLAHLSDQQLLDSLGAVLRTQRRALAALVAHLGEVEERRLHLCAAHSSMFAYGLGCSWVDETGARCGSHAWLELDHRHPAGKGGSSDADNLRLRCWAHNQLAAEQAFGRQHIEQARAARAQAPAAPG